MRIDPREKINAFYSSIISSGASNLELDASLQIISDADILFGRIMKTQEWRLLRYLDAILLNLYKKDSVAGAPSQGQHGVFSRLLGVLLLASRAQF